MTSSTLACIGLGVAGVAEFDALLDRMLEETDVVGRPGAVETRRWYDPSGALLTVTRRGEEVLDLVPSFSGRAGATLAELKPFGGHVRADLRQDGVTVGRIACALPQAPYLPRIPVDLTPAALTLLGLRVTVHADAAAFEASDASLLGGAEGEDADGSKGGSEAGDDEGDEEAGPLRFAAEALLPYGLFEAPDPDSPMAFVAGTVVLSETCTNSLTGQLFHAMTLRTVGCTATLCLAADEHPELPPEGAVVAGLCYLVADVPALWKVQPKPRRRWLKRG